MTLLIAYYRVSTKRQGQTGYGLDAQRAAVGAYVKSRAGAELGAEFTEVESGTKTDAERPQLAAALARCRLTGATLVVAKLDRLARNASFLHRLREAGIEFVACDLPSANRMTLGIMAEIAEHEVEMIRKRTKEGIAAARARGVKWGMAGADRTPEHLDAMRARATESRRANADARYADLDPLVLKLHEELGSYERVAQRLNEMHVRTRSGRGQWTKHTVLRTINHAREVFDV